MEGIKNSLGSIHSNVSGSLSSALSSSKTTLSNVRSKIPLDDSTLMIIGISLGILVLVALVMYILKKNQLNKQNPVFYRYSKDADEAVTIPDKLLHQPKDGYSFTWNFWMYLNDWTYRLNQSKHVFTKGRLEWTPVNCSPAVWIADKTNDLLIYMQTNHGTKQFVIKDIPIKKWTQFTLVLQTMEMDAYVDGKLKDTFVLKGLPKINHGDLYLNEFGGYSGSFSSIQYYPSALEPPKILKKFKEGPTQLNPMQKFIKNVKKAAKALGLGGSDKEPGKPANKCSGYNKNDKSIKGSVKKEMHAAKEGAESTINKMKKML